MGQMKPLGSEKLSNDLKLKRILELTYYQTESTPTKNDAEFISEQKNCVFGIVKEKDGYYVKRGLTESTLDYIGGLFMKNKNRFSSYGEALKRLDLLQGQEILREETKYMLKPKKDEPVLSKEAPISAPSDVPTPEAPMGDPSMGGEGDLPPEDASLDQELPDEELPDPEMGDDEEGGVTLKSIQKLTGKLGQKIREFDEEMESDDIKYVLNSIISAVNLEKLSDDDLLEITSKLEGEEDEEGMGGDEFSDELPEPEGEEDFSDEGGELEEILNQFSDEEDEDEDFPGLNELLDSEFEFEDEY